MFHSLLLFFGSSSARVRTRSAGMTSSWVQPGYVNRGLKFACTDNLKMCFVGWSVVLTLYANRGGCQHIWDVEKRGIDNLTRAILLNWTSQIFGIVGVASGKISISALLLNIMRDMGWTWQRIYLWSVTIIFTSLVAISCSLLTFLQCRPPQRLWDPRIDGTCLDPKVMAAYGIFTGCKSVR